VTKVNTAPTTATNAVVAQPRLPIWLLAVVLVLVTMALYWPVRRYGFLNLDDPAFVTENPHVQGGLSWEGVKWAFQLTQGQVDYWHPLTWLSLMLDESLFGPTASGLHLTNVALHAANSVLVLLLLRLLTGAVWRSAVVAALFALHPLRVESVAWVTERKDVLSAFFGLLSLIFYVRYAQRRMQNLATRDARHATRFTFHVSRFTFHAGTFYLLSLCFLACGLMSKAMLVTWPFVMLLLDYWPLGRMQIAECRMRKAAPPVTLPALRSTLFRLVREKIPFFVLSGSLCVITYLTETGVKASAGLEESSGLLRLENAFVAYARYLGKTFWPVNLAVPYTRPDHWPGLEVGGSMLVVVGLGVLVLWLGRQRPYLVAGWCWFMGTLIPVIGLTKGWGCFMADRFTYVSCIGLLLAIVWGAYELTRRWRYQLTFLAAVGAAAIVLCLVVTRQQLGCWEDSETLFRHSLAVTENNDVAHNNLGIALEKKGQIDEAIRQLQEAIRLAPHYAHAHNNLGNALAKQGQSGEAIRHYQEAIRLYPDYAEAHYNLGLALDKQGQMDEAIRQLEEAIRLNTDYADAHNNLGTVLDKQGRIDEAIRHYEEAIRLKPAHADAHNNLGADLDEKGRIDEAIRHYQAAIRLDPAHADAHNNLGLALGKKGQTDEAIRQFQEAIRLKPDDAVAHNNLGTAFHRQGRTDEAIRQYQESLKLKPDYAEARRNLDVVLASNAQSSPPPGTSTNR
jgi:tetratricopeptide (TPR) repeat protein